MGFKEEIRFQRYLSMGAAGTAAVMRHLAHAHGHRPVELERYALSNKLWTTKVKRLRLPDVMCLRCGRRVESKAKSALQVKLSHSGKQGREWDAGMRDEDLFAFVKCDPDSDPIQVLMPPVYFTTAALREVQGSAKSGPPKSASEGSERDLTWPICIPKQSGEVLAVEERSVRTRLANGRRQSYRLSYRLPDSVTAHAYVAPGDTFVGGATPVLGVIRPQDQLNCPGDTWRYDVDLRAGELIDRYAAVKAVGCLHAIECTEVLEGIADDPGEDERVTLEAQGALARLHPTRWTAPVLERARARESRADLAMEAVFILSEIGTDEATEALRILAVDDRLDSEARAAAVWGLGVGGARRADLVLPLTADPDERVALHALAAIDDLPPDMVASVQKRLGGDDREAAAAVRLLVQFRQPEALLEATAWAEPARHWAVFGLGQLSPEEVRATASPRLTRELEAALRPFWVGEHRNWIRRVENTEALLLLTQQTTRHAVDDVDGQHRHSHSEPPDEPVIS